VLSASGGTAPYRWSVTAASLPAGLNLSVNSGIISGTPSTAGTSDFAVQVQDAGQQTASANLSLAIAADSANSLIVNTSSLPNGIVATPYSGLLAAMGGTPPYYWTIAGNALPPGLSLNAISGAISGTPSGAGQFSQTVSVTDSSSPKLSGSRALTITVAVAGPPPGAVVVTNFGAIGNGITDDTGAIDAAIATLQANQILYFPCGAYAISAALSTIGLNGVTIEGATSSGGNCATLKLVSGTSFTALTIAGQGLGSPQNLVADTTSNTFTVATGGIASAGIAPGSYVLVSDIAVASNGSGSPLIATQQIAKVIAVNGDSATIENTFGHDYTLVSPYPSNQGCCPYVQKIGTPLTGVSLTHLNFDATANTASSTGALEMDYTVDSEIGFLIVSNFLQSPGTTDTVILDTDYHNFYHDITCTACGNGTTNDGHSFDIRRQSLMVLNNISVVNNATQDSFAVDIKNVNFSTGLNIIANQGGANGRPFKLLRSNYNNWTDVTGENSSNGKNGISITDVSTYNVFNNCTALNNSNIGIATFGNFNIHNSFNNCTAKYNQSWQLGQFADAFGNLDDQYTIVTGGTFCCARGGSAIIEVQSDDFTINGATISDDQGQAIGGLTIKSANDVVENNAFSGLPASKDIYAVGATNPEFSGNTTPDGTTPSGLARLLHEAKILYAVLRLPVARKGQ
jgi:Putative Ig domain